ncbi:MAG: hypothetical protein QXV62_08310, partial [Nitrososphaerota archaeon]
MGIGEYEYQRFGLRNRIERLFRYLKERTNGVPHRDHTQGTVDLNLFPNIFTLYYQTIKEGGGQT